MAEIVKNKVASGEYASESEVLRDGIRALMARDKTIVSWLFQNVAPAYDALKENPTRVLTLNHVRKRLAAEHENALIKR